MRLSTLLCLAALAALGAGCVLENPGPDPRLFTPDSLETWSNLSREVYAESTFLRFQVTKSSKPGKWVLRCVNITPRTCPRSTALLQLGVPTAERFSHTGEMAFFLTSEYEEVVNLPELRQGEAMAPLELDMDPNLNPLITEINMEYLGPSPESGKVRYAATGSYNGEYVRRRGGTATVVGSAKGIIDGRGQIAVRLLPFLPSSEHGFITGSYRVDQPQRLDELSVILGTESETLYPATAWSSTEDSLFYGIPRPNGDTLEMRMRRDRPYR